MRWAWPWAARSDRSLVRAGAEQGSVVAEFEPPEAAELQALLDDERDPVRGRADPAPGRDRRRPQPRLRQRHRRLASTLLRQLGDLLVEVHGQFDQRGLLNPQAHRAILDAFGGLLAQSASVRAAHGGWRAAAERVAGLREQLAAAQREEDYLRHRERELADLAPRAGEEEELAARRHALMNREKLVAALDEALAAVSGDGGALARLGAAERRLERSAGLGGRAAGTCRGRAGTGAGRGRRGRGGAGGGLRSR